MKAGPFEIEVLPDRFVLTLILPDGHVSTATFLNDDDPIRIRFKITAFSSNVFRYQKRQRKIVKLRKAAQ